MPTRAPLSNSVFRLRQKAFLSAQKWPKRRLPGAARGLDLRDTVKIASERWQKRDFRGQKCQRTDFFEKFRVGRKFCELFEKVTFFEISTIFDVSGRFSTPKTAKSLYSADL